MSPYLKKMMIHEYNGSTTTGWNSIIEKISNENRISTRKRLKSDRFINGIFLQQQSRFQSHPTQTQRKR